jgi:hypothetical protein
LVVIHRLADYTAAIVIMGSSYATDINSAIEASSSKNYRHILQDAPTKGCQG